MPSGSLAFEHARTSFSDGLTGTPNSHFALISVSVPDFKELLFQRSKEQVGGLAGKLKNRQHPPPLRAYVREQSTLCRARPPTTPWDTIPYRPGA